MESYSAEQIAKWFAVKAKNEKKSISYEKLQKFTYYFNNFALLFLNECVVNTKFILTENGFVSDDLIKLFKKNDFVIDETLLKNESDINSEICVKILEFVYDKLIKFDDETLINLSKLETEFVIHNDKKTANSDKIIAKNDDILSFYREIYLSDAVNNGFDITRDDIVSMISYVVLKKYEKAFRELAK